MPETSSQIPCVDGDLPRFLYKYLPPSLERLAMVFVARKLFFPSPELFNDPFDCALGIRFPNPKNLLPAEDRLLEQFYELVSKQVNAAAAGSPEFGQFLKESIAAGKHRRTDFVEKTPMHIRKMVKQLGTRFGVFSLSADARSVLMWSHYASAHKGLLLQFKTSRLVDADSGEIRCRPVKYNPEFPSLEEFMDAVSSDDPRELLLLFYGRKHEDWRYEQEFRMFSNTPNEYKDIPDSMLVGLAFGWKTTNKVKQQVKRWLKAGKWSVATLQAEPARDSFEIRFQKLADRRHR